MVVCSANPRAAKAHRESAKRMRRNSEYSCRNQRVKKFAFGGLPFAVKAKGYNGMSL